MAKYKLRHSCKGQDLDKLMLMSALEIKTSKQLLEDLWLLNVHEIGRKCVEIFASSRRFSVMRSNLVIPNL